MSLLPVTESMLFPEFVVLTGYSEFHENIIYLVVILLGASSFIYKDKQGMSKDCFMGKIPKFFLQKGWTKQKDDRHCAQYEQ